MIWAPRTPRRRSGAGRAPAGTERRPNSRPWQKIGRGTDGALMPRPIFFSAADFLADAPRQPGGARPPTVRGASLGPKSSYYLDDIILVLG